MKVLVLAADYPDNEGKITLYYIHTRNKYYIKSGLDVTVLNFATDSDYVIDDVRVISYNTYKKECNEEVYDLLILHAPNIRNHYMFLNKHGKKYNKQLFFFHGHEVLMCSKVYSKPFEYITTKREWIKDIYDYFKLKLWHYYFKKNNEKSNYIFVSKWMKNEFLKWVKLDEKFISKRMSITYNSVGEKFINNTYDDKSPKQYDFITIRGNLDGSKYCIDLVNELAKNNPNSKFLVIGKGEFFEHNEKAENLTLLEKNLSHDEIIEYINQSKCALMLTRTDAQGLMACEMATYGIPLITSDIPVCYEIFEGFKNVAYIDNDNVTKCNLSNEYKRIVNYKNTAIDCYSLENTGNKEIKIIKKIVGV